MLAPYPKQSMVNIKNMLPPEPEEGVKKPIRTLRKNLTEEVEDGYYFNLRKSIGKTVRVYSVYSADKMLDFCTVESGNTDKFIQNVVYHDTNPVHITEKQSNIL